MPDDIVLVTGAAGRVGRRLCERLRRRYTVVELDLPGKVGEDGVACDLTEQASVDLALRRVRDRHGGRIASVVHLAAYFDFTGEESPLYREVNVEGSRRLMRALQDFEVEQLVYSGTMLVHAPTRPGERIDEDSPLGPRWAYPKSKAQTEAAIREEAGDVPVLFLRLAGLYDDRTAVPTLSHQIARIHQRDPKSHLYAGDASAGQAFLHQDDMLDLFERAVDRRRELEPGLVILAGEPETMSYRALQDRIGALIHGEDGWRTLRLPRAVAKAGARIQTLAEPAIPDAYDEGDAPFVKPFMVDMASDHYALDIRRARERLGWTPERRIHDGLETLVAALEADPAAWYRDNGLTPPVWLRAAERRVEDPEALRARDERLRREEHAQGLWAHWTNAGLGLWLATSPPLLGYEDPGMIASDVIAGAAILVCALLSLSWRMAAARWATAALGVWVMASPLLFWSDNPAAYLNATLVGMLVSALAVALPPWPGVSPTAARTGPTIPKGWSFSPSDWLQRLPVIVLAVVGLLISRYLAAYQLGSIDGVWDPVFAGTEPGLNGTEDIVTSRVSEAWPVPDAGVGALTYALEIVVGVVGSTARWRTMPWLVTLFGLMIVPLGAVSIFFIVIQPVLLGTYCTLCLVAAAAMVLQIPYSLDELVATWQFLRRRSAAGQPWLKIFFVGDTDEGSATESGPGFERSPAAILSEMLTGGLAFSRTLWASAALGVGLMLAPLAIGWAAPMAAVFHIAGALVVTAAVAALAPVARLARVINIAIGIVLLFAPLVTEASWTVFAGSAAAGLALIALSVPRGEIRQSYGDWDPLIR